MKFTWLIVFGILLQLLSVDTASYAHDQNDQFSSGDHHFAMALQTDQAVRLFSENEESKLRKQPHSFFSKSNERKAFFVSSEVTQRYGSSIRILRPLRYQLCVLRL